MQINNLGQNNQVLTNTISNHKIEKENISENIQAQNEELENKKYQDVLDTQDKLIQKVSSNLTDKASEVSEDLDKINDSLRLGQEVKKFNDENFSKINQDFLKANQESFKNAQQANATQSQLASLLA